MRQRKTERGTARYRCIRRTVTKGERIIKSENEKAGVKERVGVHNALE